MSRELTRQEKAAIRSLGKRWCAKYDKDAGCLLLDCECYMLGKCWTGAYCRYFRSAVLPLDPVLERSLTVEAVVETLAAIRRMTVVWATKSCSSGDRLPLVIA